jgi:hypothetical protein
MNLDEIMQKMDTTSDYETLIEKLRIQLGCRKPYKLFSLISDIIGVNEASMTRWLTGKRAVTKQTLRSLQMLDLLLRMSNNFNSIPLREIPVIENKAANKVCYKSKSSTANEKNRTVEDILSELDID